MKTAGYFCECPSGRIGNGFKTAFGGDGCSDTCELFTLDCSNDHFVIEFNSGMILDIYCSVSYGPYDMVTILWSIWYRLRFQKTQFEIF